MHRARLAASALALTIAWIGAAEAQTTSQIQVGVTSFPNHANPTLANLGNPMGSPITTSDCGESITFRFTGVDTTRTNLFFYQGSMCDDVTVRNSTTQQNCTQLDVTPVPTSNRSQIDATVPVTGLVPCATGGSGVRNIFVLALNNTSDTVTGSGQMATFPLAYDFVGPGAPSGFAATGGSAAHLTWEASTDQVSSYEIFITPGCGGTSGADASTSGLDASVALDGAVADASVATTSDAGAPTGEPTATAGSGSTSANVPFPASVPEGSEASVAIRAVDRSGNKGALSNVICVQHYAVTTWHDTACGGASPPAWCSSNGCAVAPAKSGAPLELLALGIAVLGLAARRSRR